MNRDASTTKLELWEYKGRSIRARNVLSIWERGQRRAQLRGRVSRTLPERLMGIFVWSLTKRYFTKSFAWEREKKVERSKYVCRIFEKKTEKTGNEVNKAEWRKQGSYPPLQKGHISRWWCFRLLG